MINTDNGPKRPPSVPLTDDNITGIGTATMLNNQFLSLITLGSIYRTGKICNTDQSLQPSYYRPSNPLLLYLCPSSLRQDHFERLIIIDHQSLESIEPIMVVTRILRFEVESGTVHYGDFTAHHATPSLTGLELEVLEGDLFTGLSLTGKKSKVYKVG